MISYINFVVEIKLLFIIFDVILYRCFALQGIAIDYANSVKIEEDGKTFNLDWCLGRPQNFFGFIILEVVKCQKFIYHQANQMQFLFGAGRRSRRGNIA